MVSDYECLQVYKTAMKAVCAQVCFAHVVEHTESLLLGQIEMFSFVVTALMTDNFVPSMEKCVYQWEWRDVYAEEKHHS